MAEATLLQHTKSLSKKKNIEITFDARGTKIFDALFYRIRRRKEFRSFSCLIQITDWIT